MYKIIKLHLSTFAFLLIGQNQHTAIQWHWNDGASMLLEHRYGDLILGLENCKMEFISIAPVGDSLHKGTSNINEGGKNTFENYLRFRS